MKITTHRELDVYSKAIDASMEVFELSKLFPKEETQAWLEFAVKCEYIERDSAANPYRTYDEVIGTFAGMINNTDKWLLRTKG